MSDTGVFDVAIVGASLAGSTAAALLARDGARVALIERHADPVAFKQPCTHFIQPSALPVLQRLGLDQAIEQVGGLRNPIETWTPHGWIGHALSDEDDDGDLHGFNLRREVLDPLVRRTALQTPGVTGLQGATALGLVRNDDEQIRGVVVRHGGGIREVHARLVVAADGRMSDLARLAGVPTRRVDNGRHSILLSVRGARHQRGSLSQMWMSGPDVAYAFPNDSGVSVLAWVAPKAWLASLSREQQVAALKARFAELPDAPDLHNAEPVGSPMAVKDHPCLWRPAAFHGMALIGDAATSLDYLYGIGCGWAFQSAAWLADEVRGVLQKGGAPLDRAVAAYARMHDRQVGPHRFFINDFAQRQALNPLEHLFFSAAARDRRVAQQVVRVGSRLSTPWSMLRPDLLARSLWAHVRHPHAPVEGTRVASPPPAPKAWARAA